MKKYIIPIIISIFLFASCSEYQKLLKSTDPELKYDKGVEYFNAKKYSKAITLLDEVSTYYNNSDRSEMILNFLAQANMARKDNYSASDDYRNEIALQGDYGRVIEQASAVLSSSDYMIFISRAKKAIMATDYLNRYYRDCFVIDFNSAKDNIENKLKSKDEQEMDESER